VEPFSEGAVAIVHPESLCAESSGSRVAWTHLGDDLAVNVIALNPGERIAPHVNAEVDVLLVVISGDGFITVEEREMPVHAGHLAVIRKGAVRGISAGAARLVYATCHCRRHPLLPRMAPTRSTSSATMPPVTMDRSGAKGSI
jgi:quercetin dioxygenase-like cupin family protein